MLVQPGPYFRSIWNFIDVRKDMARDGSNKVCSSEVVLSHPQFGIVNGFGMLYGIARDIEFHHSILIIKSHLNGVRVNSRNFRGCGFKASNILPKIPSYKNAFNLNVPLAIT